MKRLEKINETENSFFEKIKRAWINKIRTGEKKLQLTPQKYKESWDYYK